MSKIKLFHATTAVALVSALGFSSYANPALAEYPEKPITVIYPWSPGDPVGGVLRVLTEFVAEDLGQPIVINNVQGAGGKKATLVGAQADSDGYTLLNNWVAPQIAGKLFDPDLAYSNEDFVPIAGIYALPFTITVAADHPSNSVSEFQAWAAEKGVVNFGVCPAQSVPRLVGEQFMRVAGVEYNPIPNAGGCMGDNMSGLLNGSLDVSVSIVPATTILEGQVKHLALMRDEPLDSQPDLKTAKEQGVDIGWGDVALGWGGIAAPAGTPEEVVTLLQGAFREVAQSNEFLEALGTSAHLINYTDPANYADLWADSMELLKPHVDALKAAEAK